MYKVINAEFVKRLTDGATIPTVAGNRHFDKYLAWLAEGNAPAPADAPLPPTPLQQIRALEQAHEDDQRKLTRTQTLATALDKKCQEPEMAGKTRDEVDVLYRAANRGYRELSVLEAACVELRKLMV